MKSKHASSRPREPEGPPRPTNAGRYRYKFPLGLFLFAVSIGLVVSTARADDKPTTVPATVSTTDGVAADKIQSDDEEINFTDKLSPPLANVAVYFGEVDHFDDPDDERPSATSPVIGVKDGDGWKIVRVDGSVSRNMNWKYVAAGPGPREMWGVLDTAVGDAGPFVVLAHSTDGGTTFAMSTIKKVCRRATWFHFMMARGGTGKLVLDLTSACGKHQPGLYEYPTTDGGKTWADKPTYVPDAMVPADGVDDDEQPAAPEAAKKTSHRPPAVQYREREHFAVRLATDSPAFVVLASDSWESRSHSRGRVVDWCPPTHDSEVAPRRFLSRVPNLRSPGTTPSSTIRPDVKTRAFGELNARTTVSRDARSASSAGTEIS